MLKNLFQLIALKRGRGEKTLHACEYSYPGMRACGRAHEPPGETLNIPNILALCYTVKMKQSASQQSERQLPVDAQSVTDSGFPKRGTPTYYFNSFLPKTE